MAGRHCSECGYQLPSEAAFCGRCGAPVMHGSSSLRRLFAVGGAVLLVVLLAAGFFLRQELRALASSASGTNGAGPAVAVGSEPATETPGTVEGEADSAPTATIPPAVAPTKTDTPTPTTVPSKTPSPTLPPTLTPTPTLTPSPTITPTLSPGPETTVIGYSMNDRPIEVVRFGTGEKAIVFIGGIHAGFAPGSVLLAQRVVEYFTENQDVIPPRARVYIIPSMNPDSANSPGQLSGRLNARGVDLNRNWACEWRQDPVIDGRTVRGAGGAGPLSEPETQAVANFVLEQAPAAVIFWEARAANGLVSPGGCGPPGVESYDLAITYAQSARYRWDDFESLIGHVVQGDASNWFDLQGIPAAVVLMPTFSEPDWERNRAAIEEVLRVYGGAGGR